MKRESRGRPQQVNVVLARISWLTWLRRGMLVSVALLLNGIYAHAQLTVGPNVLVSAARAQTVHNEVVVAADPADANRLLVCSMAISQVGSARHPTGTSPAMIHESIVAYTSFDRGQHWQAATETSGLDTADPSCAYGSDGSAYLAWLEVCSLEVCSLDLNEDRRRLLSVEGWHRVLQVRRSTDAGRTWSLPSVLRGSDGADRDWIAVDLTSGRYRGQLYIFAQVPAPRPEDNPAGWMVALWQHPADSTMGYNRTAIRAYPEGVTLYPGNCVVRSDGAVVCGVAETDRRVGTGTPTEPTIAVRAIRSVDGGQSLLAPIVVSGPQAHNTDQDLSSGPPALAVDAGSGPFHNRLYMVWSDRRSGRDEIYLSWSSNGGGVWSRPSVVNDDAVRPGADSGPDDFMPEVAVNNAGVVGVSWYDRRSHMDNVSYDVRFAASLDGGETFLPSVQVSEKSYTFGGKEIITLLGWAGDASAVRDGTVQIDIYRNEWFT